MTNPTSTQATRVDAAFQAMLAALEPAYVATWPAATLAALRNSVEVLVLGPHASHQAVAAQANEPHITALLESLTAGEAALIDLLWRTSNQHLGRTDPAPDGARLYRLADFLARGTWARDTTLGKLKLPDLVVAHPDPTDPAPAQTRRLVLDVVVEVKGAAAVNGGYGYCVDTPAGTDPYSNQAICYVHGCWANLADKANALDFRSARFVWIGPDTSIDSRYGPWGSRGLVDADRETRVSDAGTPIDPAIDLQAAAARWWAGLRLSDVEATLRDVPGGTGVIADVLGAWRTRKGL